MSAQDHRRPGWVRRHKALVILLGVAVLAVGAAAGWVAYLNRQIDQVERVHLDLPQKHRPERSTGDAAEAINILIAGADAGRGPSIAETVASGTWQPGSHRSDTIMILHITADRDKAYLISIPRDTWVHIPGYGMSKVNAAFSYGGPSLYVQTIEKLTGLRMDHLAIIDWDGFKDLTKALGGVEIYIPQTVTDSSQGITWEKGTQTLAGKEALQYVRTRHGLPHGDFDRIDRQQNFLRATMEKLLSQGTLSNPIKLTNVLKAITSNLTVDEEFSTGEMRDLALSLRGLGTGDVTFLTIPIKGLDTVDGQSIVRYNNKKTAELFDAVAADELDQYLKTHHAELLPDAHSVS